MTLHGELWRCPLKEIQIKAVMSREWSEVSDLVTVG
jgi:hypothetical protein